jgi:anti-sigma regulatory factor (Ser/Thr protein kinase)
VIYELCRDARTQDIKGVTLGLYEAVANAVYHGNLELDSAIKETDDGFTKYEELANKRMNEEKYRNRRVIVSFEQNNGVIKYVVSDDGDGFNWRKIPEPDSEEMFSFPGRGIMLMKFYYHAVEWNEKGNEITLTYIPTSAGPAK